MKNLQEGAIGLAEYGLEGDVDGGPAVDEPGAVGAEQDAVGAAFRGETLRSARFHFGERTGFAAGGKVGKADAVELGFDRGDFSGGIIDVSAVVVNVFDVGAAGSEAPYAALHITEVQLAVAVADVGAVDEEFGALDEEDALEGLHPGGVVLAEEGPEEGAVGSVVDIEVEAVLAAVDDLDEKPAAVGSPGDAGEVALVGEVGDLKGIEDITQGVADAKADVLGGHAVHGITYAFEAAGAGGDVQQGELADGAFIDPVNGQTAAVGRRVVSAVYAELVAGRDLAVCDCGAVAGGEFRGLGALEGKFGGDFRLCVPAEVFVFGTDGAAVDLRAGKLLAAGSADRDRLDDGALGGQ